MIVYLAIPLLREKNSNALESLKKFLVGLLIHDVLVDIFGIFIEL